MFENIKDIKREVQQAVKYGNVDLKTTPIEILKMKYIIF